jgi:hypothetical protein
MNTHEVIVSRDVGGVYFVDDNRYHGLDASARPCAVVVSAHVSPRDRNPATKAAVLNDPNPAQLPVRN